MKPNILIIGAGFGGVICAKDLAKSIGKEANIVLVDKRPFHTMLTELHEVAAGRVEEDSIRLPLNKIFARRPVKIVIDNITSIDFEGREAKGESGVYPFDYLVIATGCKPNFFGIPGSEHAFTLWSYDDAVRLKDRIEHCFRVASEEKDESERRKLLSFCIVGMGFSGVEMAGELAEWAPILCDKFGISRKSVNIMAVDTVERIMPSIPEKLSKKVTLRLSKMGVNTLFSSSVMSMAADSVEIKTPLGPQTFTVGTIIWTAGTKTSDLAQSVSGELPSQRGRIEVDAFCRSPQNERVYVVGDNMYYLPDGKQPVPQMVENCEQSSKVAAHNIEADIKNTKKIPYKPNFHGVMVSVGGRYGVAHIGTAKKKWAMSSFFAMFAKHFINMFYFIQVLGWNKVFSYMKHEFFTIRNKRSFVGGHFSNRTPSFLLVLLRVWLGLVWLFEGLTKIFEGWLVAPKLDAFFNGANTWYNAILGQLPLTEAVSEATGATGESLAQSGQVIINWNFWLFKVIFVSGKEIVHSTLGDFAIRFDVPLLNTFINNVVLPNNWLQMAMQIFIVVAEILIGLALIAGLFNFLASLVSLVLQMMFITTTGLYLNTIWMIPAAVAILWGGGSILGLDYYVIPYIKCKWNNTAFARKTYLYHD